MAKAPIDGDLVRSLAALLDEARLSEIEYETAGVRIRVVRQGASVIAAVPAPAAAVPAPPQPAPAAAAEEGDHPGTVTSPMVGVAYLSPEPGKPPFVKVGEAVGAGETLLLIEAMKTFNPIRAHRAGTLQKVFVTDGQPVEFGEPLAVIG